MKCKFPLFFVEGAVASDGGTLAVQLSDRDGVVFGLMLDRKIGTATYDRLYLMGTNLISRNDEEVWYVELDSMLREFSFKCEDDRRLISTIVDALRARKSVN